MAILHHSDTCYWAVTFVHTNVWELLIYAMTAN